MKKLILFALLAFPVAVQANGTPTWTTGSSNRTENTTQTIDRTIVTEKYGAAVNTWEATNITVTSATDGGIEAADAIFTPTDNTAEWTLSTTTKAASQMIEKITQTDDITTTRVITSLSVFSQ